MVMKQLDRMPSMQELMRAKQDEMEAALSANRRVMPHEGEKGAATELHWRKMLAAYLPRRYTVTTGFVVDHLGNPSEQIDVIIHDAQYSPFLFRAGTSSFVPAESVYAILDAKQEISAESLRETGRKVASVRQLERTSGDVWSNVGRHEGKSPDSQPILGGILAVTTQWKPEPFGEAFRRNLSGLSALERLDLGVAVSSGAFECKEDADPLIYHRGTALVGFFMALIRHLQPLATALAMDLDVWGAPIRVEPHTGDDEKEVAPAQEEER